MARLDRYPQRLEGPDMESVYIRLFVQCRHEYDLGRAREISAGILMQHVTRLIRGHVRQITKSPCRPERPAGALIAGQGAEAEGLEPPSGCPRRISSAVPYQLGLRLLVFSRDGRI